MRAVAGISEDTWSGIRKELEAQISLLFFPEVPVSVDFLALEHRLAEALRGVGRRLLEEALAHEPPVRTAQLESREGGPPLGYKGMRGRKLHTRFGPVSYARSYFRCKESRESRWPKDEALGLGPKEIWSPGLRETGAYLATVTSSYQEGAAALQKLLGVEIEYKQLQRECQKIGEVLEERGAREVEAAFACGDSPELPWEGVPAMVIGTDGITVPHYAGESMEIKVGRIDVVELVEVSPPSDRPPRKIRPRQRPEGEAAPPEDPARRREIERLKQSPESLEYRGASGLVDEALAEAYPERSRRPRLQSVRGRSTYRATARLGVQALGRQLWVAARDDGLGVNTDVTYLSDGGAWCRSLAEEHFPWSTKILDVFHLARHVYRASTSLFGKRSIAGRRWRQLVLVRLLRGEAAAVLTDLRQRRVEETERHREAKSKLAAYLEANLDRVDYPEYVAAGRPIGSGTIEGACRNVVGTRMKGSGRRWSDDGAETMARLRSLHCSRQWEDGLVPVLRAA